MQNHPTIQQVLDEHGVTPEVQALVHNAYNMSSHEDNLRVHLDKIPIPQQAKAEIWQAKRDERIPPGSAIDRLVKATSVDPKTLQIAEQFPNTMKLLMQEKGEGKAEKPGKNGKEPEAKEPENESHMEVEGAEDKTGQPELQSPEKELQQETVPPEGYVQPGYRLPADTSHEQQGRMSQQASMIHFKASDGTMHAVPEEHIATAASIDPGLQIIHS